MFVKILLNLYLTYTVLSPLQEEQESRLTSISGDLRPDSPLPDLIIEIEPKKPNLCDEPEEFYKKLAKEMRRLYKRDHYCASDSTVRLDYLKAFKENEELLTILTELSSSDDNSLHVLQELENTGDHTHYDKVELKERESFCKRQNVIEEYSTSSSEGNFGSPKKIHSEQFQIPYDENSSEEDTQEVINERYSQTVIPAESCNKSVRNYDENIRHESDVDTENTEEEEEEIEEEVVEEEYESLAINSGMFKDFYYFISNPVQWL